MRFKLTISLLVFCFNTSFAQKAKKVEIIDFKATECNDGVPDAHMLRTRIISKDYIQGLFILKIGMTEVCCLSFKPVVSIKLNRQSYLDTLSVGYNANGDACECKCYYELVYKLKGMVGNDFTILFRNKPIEFTQEKYLTYPIEFKVVGNDTINYIDKYGMRQGVWIQKSDSLRNGYYEFVNGVAIRDVYLYQDGKIKREARKEYGNWNYLVEYFENGQKKYECYNDKPGESFRDGKCKEWDINGDLIYEGPYKKPIKFP